jgi:cellulose synthase/poly-beta-1,6-N-acetylglucosamine synthase-like glycosyltransferase
MALIIVLATCILLTILKDVYLLRRIKDFVRPAKTKPSDDLPFVSILVAARNEESTIERCLEGLARQKYPEDKIEILVGNDGSEDRTLEVARKYGARDSRIEIYDIDKLVVDDYGKMNVLVQLIAHAKGDILLFTDADTQANPQWTMQMTTALQAGYGVVTGVTLMDAKRMMDKFQYIDWLQAQAMVKVLEDSGTRVTSLGNNMGVTREAYEAVGGFEGVSFSITEDYELYCAIIDHGFAPLHIYAIEAMGITLPMPSTGALLEQRKRWMYGVVKLPFQIVLFLLLNALFIPVLILLIFVSPMIGIGLGILRFLIQVQFFNKLQRLLHSRLSLFWLFPFEFYQSFINLTTLIYFLSPLKATWKGRAFN